MRFFLLYLLLLFCSSSIWAQKIDVAACYIDRTDSTAIQSPVQDAFQPGKYCALLKVQLDAEDADFDNIGIVEEPIRKDKEYWIYMCDGSKKITITVPGYLPKEVSFSDYGVDMLQGLKVYRLLVGRRVTIEECILDVMDFTPSSFEGRREETPGSGNYCALVKVQLATNGANFIGDVVGDVDYSRSVYNVYMRANSRKLTVNIPGYLPCEIDFSKYLETMTLEGKRAYKVVLSMPDNGGSIIVYQKIQVSVTPSDARLSIDDEPALLEDGYFSKDLPEGKHSYRAEADGYFPTERVFSILGPQDTIKINLEKIPVTTDPVSTSPLFNIDFYVGANYQIGSLSGVGTSLGTYFNNFNLQVDVLVGLQESEPIFWNGTSADPYSYTYKPIYMGMKLGYGIKVGEKLRFTPQIGAGISKISGTVAYKGQGTDPNVRAMTVVPLSVSLRSEWLIAKHFGLSIAPEYDIALQKGKPYDAVSTVSSTVKGFGQGFNLKAGLFVCF